MFDISNFLLYTPQKNRTSKLVQLPFYKIVSKINLQTILATLNKLSARFAAFSNWQRTHSHIISYAIVIIFPCTEYCMTVWMFLFVINSNTKCDMVSIYACMCVKSALNIISGPSEKNEMAKNIEYDKMSGAVTKKQA